MGQLGKQTPQISEMESQPVRQTVYYDLDHTLVFGYEDARASDMT